MSITNDLQDTCIIYQLQKQCACVHKFQLFHCNHRQWCRPKTEGANLHAGKIRGLEALKLYFRLFYCVTTDSIE